MKFCDCGKMFTMFDDLEERQLYHNCTSCDLKIPYETQLIYSKRVNKQQHNWNKFDKTLPISDKKCYKCNGTVIYKKRSDLTLEYTCQQCNEEWY